MLSKNEAKMCFLGVIEVFFDPQSLINGAVNTTLHIINLILYIIYWSIEDTNVFFWSVEPGIPVYKDKG